MASISSSLRAMGPAISGDIWTILIPAIYHVFLKVDEGFFNDSSKFD
jgi:hypothetical protein